MEPATVAADVQRVLGTEAFDASRILSVYLYGSALWGGFDARTSDVDLIVVAAADPPLIDSYEQVRRFARAMPATYRLDISTSLVDQLDRPVPCRPFILHAAADHGWLVHGQPTLREGRPLDKTELVDALDFNLRQLSRNLADVHDPCWEEIISRQIKAHFLQLSQLLHSRRPDIPFAPNFRLAVQQAASVFPSLAGQDELVAAAVVSVGSRGRLEAAMKTLLLLRDVVQHGNFTAGTQGWA